MNFKRNLTVSFACHTTEFALCLIPMFLVMGFSIDKNSFAEYCKDMFSIYPLVLLIVNAFLFVLSLIFSIFQKQTFILNDDHMLIENKDEMSKINYNDIKTVSFDLGNTGKMSARPMELRLLGEKNKELLSITNPSILMTHILKKKCIYAKTTYRNSKKFIWYLLLSILVAIVTVVKSHL